MDADLDKRALFETGLAEGKSVKELTLSLGIPKSTAYQWRAAKEEQSDEHAAPQSVAPPAVETTRARGGRKKLSVRPISEETAGQLCAGMFFMACAIQNEPEWLLTDAERSSLAGPLADSLRVMPAPVADAINTYSAPAVFLTSLSAVVMAKGRRIAAKRSGRRLQAVPPRSQQPAAPQFTPPPTPPVPDVQGDAKPAADITDQRSAFAAAKGNLTALDEHSDGEGAFA